MKVKLLAEGKYLIVGLMDGEVCPAEDFVTQGEAETKASREGLAAMLLEVAEKGLHGVPTKWWHEANKQEQVYEFIKGPLRLFFFKGEGGQIAVCTSGVRKKGAKADKASVKAASAARKSYFEAVEAQVLEIVSDGEDQ